MHALHQNLLPASAIYHALFLPNFTPSTIYPLPQPVNAPEVKVVGNLIVAGGQDLRVFEVREETERLKDPPPNGLPNGTTDGVEPGLNEHLRDEIYEVEDDHVRRLE